MSSVWLKKKTIGNPERHWNQRFWKVDVCFRLGVTGNSNSDGSRRSINSGICIEHPALKLMIVSIIDHRFLNRVARRIPERKKSFQAASANITEKGYQPNPR